MSLADKLLYLYETKKSIKEALETKGIEVNSATFREYAGLIESIVSEDPKNLEELYFYRNAFYKEFENNELIIPDFVTNLTTYQFASSSLTSVTLTEKIKEIPNYCFSGSNSIETINLEKVEHICDHAFYQCSNIRSVNLENIRVIDTYAFAYCSTLNEIRIGNKIEEIAAPTSSLQRPFASIDYGATFYIDKPFGSLEVPSNHWGATNSTIYWNDGVITPPNESVSKIF